MVVVHVATACGVHTAHVHYFLPGCAARTAPGLGVERIDNFSTQSIVQGNSSDRDAILSIVHATPVAGVLAVLGVSLAVVDVVPASA